MLEIANNVLIASPKLELAKSLEELGFINLQLCDKQTLTDNLADKDFSIILLELNLPQNEDLDLISKVRELSPQSSLLVLSNSWDIKNELQVIAAGAHDCLDISKDLLTLKKYLLKWQERLNYDQSSFRQNSKKSQRISFSNLIAESAVMKEIFTMVERLAHFSTTVLITGESGTGKELLAKAIHQNSTRKNKSFVAINCGAIPENLMESELFGHKKGAFTDATKDKKGLFEEADGGTLFLDEIGEMPQHLQVKLLRALQEQQIRRVGDEQVIDIDVRVIAATLRNLEEDVEDGRFREDLYYRLNVVAIHLPPLRERKEDLPALIEHFIKKHNKRLNLSVKGLTPEALKKLMAYSWKGNIRELENCIERALVLADDDYIIAEALPESMNLNDKQLNIESQKQEISDDNLSIKQRSRALEINLILRALKKVSGNRTKAAKILEISHRALLYKLKEYGLS